MKAWLLSLVLDDVKNINKIQIPRVLLMLTSIFIVYAVFFIDILVALVDQISNDFIIAQAIVLIAIQMLISLYVSRCALSTPIIKHFVNNSICEAQICGKLATLKENIGIGKDSLSMNTAVNAMGLAVIRGLISFLLPMLMKESRICVEQMETILKACDLALVASFLAMLIMFTLPNIIMYSLYSSSMTAYGGVERVFDKWITSDDSVVESKEKYSKLKYITSFLIMPRFWLVGTMVVIILSLGSISINDAVVVLKDGLQSVMKFTYMKLECTGNIGYAVICIIGFFISEFIKKCKSKKDC